MNGHSKTLLYSVIHCLMVTIATTKGTPPGIVLTTHRNHSIASSFLYDCIKTSRIQCLHLLKCVKLRNPWKGQKKNEYILTVGILGSFKWYKYAKRSTLCMAGCVMVITQLGLGIFLKSIFTHNFVLKGC